MFDSSTISVKWTSHGFHCWSNAGAATEGRRSYLEDRHRHLFYYKVTVSVEHNDREIEFHELLDLCKAFTEQRTEHGTRSCEMLGAELLDYLESEIPSMSNRVRSCSVWEDNEVGATITRRNNDS